MTAAEIARALGGAKRNGRGWVARCCCHEDKSPSLSLGDGASRLLVHCFAGCDVRDILAELRRRGWIEDVRRNSRRVRRARPAPIPKQTEPDRSSHFAGTIWREAVDPRGTFAEKYLNGRGLKLDDDLCGALRFHGRCPFGKGEDGATIYVPALIAAFRPFRNDDESAPPAAIHRIALNPDGSRIAKMMLGPVGGCAVKLDPDDVVEHGLGICEGIETGLAIRATGWRPVWALGSAGAIRTLAPIPGIEALTIFADRDKIDPRNGKRPGQDAARKCAQTWHAAGHEVLIRTPRGKGADWLDMVQS